MLGVKCVLLLTLTAACQGNFLDSMFPSLMQTVRRLGDDFKQGALGISDKFVSLFKVPKHISSRLGKEDNVPPLMRTNDKVDSGRILAEYLLDKEDAYLDIMQLVRKYQYAIETHTVTTKDGYVLTMHRIPRSGSPVFLMHGILGSADDFVIAGVETGLAYLLAREGYDVWMGNARGNKHSRRHVRMSPSEAAFWDFSWHEIGYYDLPAMIDYIQDETRQARIKYIGHSQGTTAFFVMASDKPEYSEKISVMIALSPVAYMSNAKSPMIRLLAPGSNFIHSVSKALGVHEFLPDNNFVKILKHVMCGHGPLAEIFCTNNMLLVAGFSFAQMNVSNFPVLLGHFPSGASAKQFAHYGQGVVSRRFEKFDYGTVGNKKRYAQINPPGYALEKIEVPIYLFYAEADWLAHPTDVQRLFLRLPNTTQLYKVAFEPFNHLDFLYAKDFKKLIYEKLRECLLMY